MKSKLSWVALLVMVALAAVLWNLREQEPPLSLTEVRTLKNPLPASAENVAAAKMIYADKCEHCHGIGGRGDGPDASLYEIRPADLTAQKLVLIPEGELFFKISEGRRPMPAFRGQLTREQRWQLVHFVRSLAKNGI
jgi:mono/diheme cytochrome c family protein